jgi:hypothetical protein
LLDYDGPPPPPALNEAEAAWVDDRLRATGWRRSLAGEPVDEGQDNGDG